MIVPNLLLLLRERKHSAQQVVLNAKQRQVAAELKVVTDWGTSQNVPLMAGEFGWPNQTAVGASDATNWNAVGTYYYQQATARGVPTARNYGVFGADTAAKKKQFYAAGGNLVHIPAFWDQLQLSQGAALDATALAALNTAISDAKAAGCKVVLECCLQYPPAWVLSGVPQFKDQSANLWSATQASGNNVRDWIFSATGRTYVADFITKIIAGINKANVDFMRTGGGYAGELHYPPVDNNTANFQAFWSFSAPAQTGTGIASGLTASPYPGNWPYKSGNTSTQNDALRDWHVGALINFEQFLIDTHVNAGWTKELYMLHPGFGVRTNWATDGTQLDYVHNVATGEWFERAVSQYAAQSTVWPWSTWLDAPHAWEADPLGADSNKAAWLKLLEVAYANSKHSKIMGENTGGNGTTEIDRVFDRPLNQTYLNTLYATTGRPVYQGILWLNWASLTDGSGDTLAYLSNRIWQDDRRVWLTNWSSGAGWGTSYNLGVDVNAGSNIDTAQSQSVVHEAFKSTPALMVGTNVAGIEFGVHSNRTFDYAGTYPSSTDCAFLYGKGIRFIRLPISWERIQPNLNGALDATAQTNLTNAVAAAKGAGLGVIIDVHNYCRYLDESASAGTIVTKVMSTAGATLNATHLTNLWGRLSDLFKNEDAVIGYDLMNEPHDLVSEPGGFVSNATVYDWEGGVTGWIAENGSDSVSSDATLFHDGTKSLKFTSRALSTGTTYFLRCKGNNTTPALPGGTGQTTQVWVYCPTGQGSWRARIDFYDSSFSNQQSASGTTNLTAGGWTLVSDTFSQSFAGMKNWVVQFENTTTTYAGVATFNIDTFQIGSAGAGLSSAQVWENISQQVVTYLRGTKTDNKLVLVEGYDWAHAHNWSTNHPAKWITDPANNTRYQFHHYWDNNKSGTYANNFTTELANSVSAGY